MEQSVKKITEIDTQRLRLRQWCENDLPLFAALNADPAVMQYYPNILDKKQSDELAEKFRTLIANRGWGLWAVEKIEDNDFIGFVGLHEPSYDLPPLPLTPCVEIGWRVAQKHWGNGYATEAAKASLAFAFEKLGLEKVYSFTSVSNKQSRAVMARIGMINTGENFEHPLIPTDSPLLEHVLYKIDKQHWKTENPL